MMGISVEKVRKAAKHNQAQAKNTHKTSPKPSQSTIEQPDDQSIVFDDKVAQNDLKEIPNTDEILETPSNASPKPVQTANDPEGSPKTKSKRKRRKKPLNSQQQNESAVKPEMKVIEKVTEVERSPQGNSGSGVPDLFSPQTSNSSGSVNNYADGAPTSNTGGRRSSQRSDGNSQSRGSANPEPSTNSNASAPKVN